MSDELLPPSYKQIEKAQEIYEELIEMDQQLKMTEMILEYFASADFLFVILTVAIGIAIVKSVNVVDKYLNGTNDNDKI